MSERSASEILETLAYLRDLGFDDLYLEPDAAARLARGRSGGAEAEPATRRVLQAGPVAGRRSDPRPSRAVATAPSTRDEHRPTSPPPLAHRDELPASSLSTSGRASDLQALAEEARGCQACRLYKGRKSVVFGSGHSNASLMLIGEGPGAEEDRQGLPFVGPAGELLTKILKAIELERSEVYIANVVKCRPPRNRDPETDEANACRGFLERQIELVRPRLIVALGRVAAQALLASGESLGRLRGRWHSVLGIPTRATYHPAALLRSAEYKRPTWEDMQAVRDRLRELDSSVE